MEKTVKLDEIPQEKPRVELADLPKENVLIAVEEHFVKATESKTGGLIITFRQKDEKEFAQKYSKLSGSVLNEALDKLRIKDTEELQKKWYRYEMTNMRSGYPRYIPKEVMK